MIKYVHFARMAFADFMRAKVRIFSRFLIYMLITWAGVSMWRVIYHTGHAPSGITVTDMGWYIGLAQMLFFLSPRIFVVIDEDVRSGNIAYFLNRPMPYLAMRLSEGLGALAVHILVYFICGAIFLYVFLGGWPSGGPESVAIGASLLITASIIHLLFQIACGLSTFWTNDAIFIYHAYQKFMILLGGVYVPISLYPSFLPPDVIHLLPFSAMIGGPASLVLGGQDVWTILALQGFWGILVFMGVRSFYALCLRKVEVNGG